MMLAKVVGAAAVLPFLVGAAEAPSGPHGDVDFSFRDPAIVESSSLVVSDGLFVTANDSGDSGRVFVIDAHTGRTVGVTSWDEAPTDVEALAPAGPGRVWVGDIGDNAGSRDSVSVLEVPYGRGDRHVGPASYPLVYPDGAHDAETLMADPRTGRLFIATKSIFGGRLYAAPRRLSSDHPNRLHAVSDVRGFATDGAFFPDGRHYVIRDYGAATVYTFPGHELVGTFRLPNQRQGEGIAVADDGTVHVTTEGQFSDVLRVSLPASIERAVQPPSPSPTPSPSSTASADGSPSPSADAGDRAAWPWLLGGVVGLGIVVALLRSLRPR